jgi:hypothetical protein
MEPFIVKHLQHRKESTQMNITDSQLLDWLEQARGQLWYNRHNKNWTCQVIYQHTIIQPTRATLRAAITDARDEATEKVGGWIEFVDTDKQPL